jgi:hypothetical protein
VATVAFTLWLPEVMPLVPGCPEPLALNAVRNASIDFCATTLWWQEDHGPVDIDATQPYAFVLAADVGLAQIMSARVVDRGYPLSITGIQELDNRVWNWRAATGEPRAIYQSLPGKVSTYPVPAGSDVYSVQFRLAFSPLRTATTIRDDLYDYYVTEIASGALEILLGMENQPWANPGLAGRYGSDFRSALVAGATDTAKSYGRQNQHVLMRHG